MQYVDLEKFAARQVQLNGDDHGLKPHRLRAERDRIAYEMLEILRPSIRRFTNRKNMTTTLKDEIDQHSHIAIMKALADWNPSIATFSTHVHWKIRAELQTLQWSEFPDRRRLSIPHRLNIMELDRPYANKDGDTQTLGDTLVTEDGEEKVEELATRYMTLHSFERVFSHSIARQMHTYCINQKDPARIAERRRALMRNRWIYVRRVLELDTYETIANDYKITRERARQIIVRVEEEVKGQLPRYCKKENEVVPATRMPPEDIHPSWDFMITDFYMATGEDTRLLNKEAKMPPLRDEYDFAPTVQVGTQAHTNMIDEMERQPTRLEVVEEPASQTVSEDEAYESNVIQMTPARRMLAKSMQQGKLGLAAGILLSSVSVANAQSRALPPMQPVTTQTTQTEKVETPKVSKPKSSATKVATTTLVSIDKIEMKTSAWGVRIAEYETEEKARSNWSKDAKKWNWLRGLKPAHIAPVTGKGPHAVAFGPLSKAQATGMCHEAQRYRRGCEVVQFGVQRSASAKKAGPAA